MDIPMNAKVLCSDGWCGHTTCIIVDPISQKITHVVVKERKSPHTERLVPEHLILESTPETIRLGCNTETFSTIDEFIELRFIHNQLPVYTPVGVSTAVWPYVAAEDVTIVSKEERIPPGELAIHRGTKVEASDGPVGRVDEFLVDPTDGKITHLILREGHIWGLKDVVIPISEIEKISDGTVCIKLNKHAIAGLPAIPVRRKWK